MFKLGKILEKKGDGSGEFFLGSDELNEGGRVRISYRQEGKEGWNGAPPPPPPPA